MRAYTSLAGHILGSNPAINGYYEMHISYDGSSAYERQIRDFKAIESIKENSCYIFDKLLHNNYKPPEATLDHIPLKILVSLREPISTISSIVDLFTQKQSDESYANPKQATEYYIERLECLANFCRTTGHDYYYFDAVLFKTEPTALLSVLSKWLELATPLSAKYQIFSQTGVARKGDTSKAIKSGSIDRTTITHKIPPIPEPLLQRAQTVYLNCRREIIENAVDSVVS
jgi:hypothetical protein